jgi:hypothetical protein
MRTYYQPESSEFWMHYLVDQQFGGGHPTFVGLPYQRGAGIGSFFRGLFRAVAPIVKSVGKTVGKEALRAGANILADSSEGRNVKESFRDHGKMALSNTLRQAGDIVQRGHGQIGMGVGTRKGLKRTNAFSRKRKRDIYDGRSIA